MHVTVRKRLEAQFDAVSVARQLHDVPPHEVYEVTVDGRRAVYKGDTGPTGNAGVEGRVTAFVGRRTSVPVPEILHAGTDFYVAAWHPDAPAPGESPPADEAWAAAAGRGLATLHDETADALERYGAFRADGDGIAVDGCEAWPDAALGYLRDRRSVLERFGEAAVADDAIEALSECRDRLDDAGGPVCCHGWATPEHVAVADGRVACVLDFEHAIAAPGEFDYWRTVMPTFTGGAEAAKRAFRGGGYESVRQLPEGFDDRQPAYVLLNLVYYVESLYVQDQHGPEETAERAAELRAAVARTIDELSE